MNTMNTVHFSTSQLTFVMALGLGALVLAMALTPIYTYFAYRYKFWKVQRETSTTGEKLTVFNKLHAHKFKRNIPTMAGLILIVSVSVITLIFNLNRVETYLPLAALIGGGTVGLIDDVINLRSKKTGVRGLRSGLKFLMISLLAVALGWWFFTKLGVHEVHIPFVGAWNLGWLIIPIFAFVVVATGNAVNISDGLDGLAGGLLSASFGAYAVIGLLEGQFILAGFCFTILGALLSYLWFNIYPARFFMGDVGSFALGTSLGVVAMLTDTLFLLPLIGIVFVVEAGSSALQILSKRLLHRKIFLSAPIHHHFEAIGWPETKVTMRFWVIGGVASFSGVIVALLGGHI
jgi:phospho-N-acetylmuramoyl-pentapeptide-transferase